MWNCTDLVPCVLPQIWNCSRGTWLSSAPISSRSDTVKILSTVRPDLRLSDDFAFGKIEWNWLASWRTYFLGLQRNFWLLWVGLFDSRLWTSVSTRSCGLLICAHSKMSCLAFRQRPGSSMPAQLFVARTRKPLHPKVSIRAWVEGTLLAQNHFLSQTTGSRWPFNNRPTDYSYRRPWSC